MIKSSRSASLLCQAVRLIVFRFIIVVVTSASTDEIIPNTKPIKPIKENSEYFTACSGGDLSKIKDFLSTDPSIVHSVTNDGEHCLHLSALSGNADIVHLLLEAGADPDIRSTFEQGLRMHPLSWCTFYGRHDIIELLLKYGADVNADFDMKVGDKDETVQVTALDVIEKIIFDMDIHDDSKYRFIETRNVLVSNGAKRYASLVYQEL